MTACDHSPMKTTGVDTRIVCLGCNAAIGKFTCINCTKVFTTETAYVEHLCEGP